ncbi:30S ribosomal protein S18 [Candidatus Cyrtobacter comes]|uniref:Small ribosomal subunit protein bS18 n=1 Tax=Candidatus Cyrtobacter comes TaxID=675776 RepID=A0ABU5L886_9RICK|nr:30S ribosomal protein S18 [Candidatus Cyrtobacter comes]MDZ5762336.1 30S ribosomal protein S18 [Candidatus Cyrtobacter comes]
MSVNLGSKTPEVDRVEVVSNTILFNRAAPNAPKVRKCPLDGIDISYKNFENLRFLLSEGGRMLAARLTGASAKNQRKLKKAIRRARMLGYLPFVQKI